MWRRFIRGYLESFGRQRVLAASAGKPQLSDGKGELRQPHSRTATPKVQRETDYANGSMNGHEMNEACPLTLFFAFAACLPAHLHTHLLGIRTLRLLTSRLLYNQVFFFPFSRSLIPPRCWKWVVNPSNHPVIKAEFNRSQPLKPFSHLIVRSLETKLRNLL